MQKLNILYLHSHDTGRYIEPYGYKVPTPNLQKFAEESVLFRQAFCACPTCSPSRAGLLTGTYPHNNGMLGLAHRGFRLNDPAEHLASFLKNAGYETALCGIQHESVDTNAIGYEQALGSWPAMASNLVPAACDFLQAKHERPFFLSVGLFETHREFPDQTVDDRYLRPPAPIIDTPETRKDMAGFATMAKTMDDGYGAVLTALDRAGLSDNTLVIITTDHGPAFPGMKCNLTDHGIGVLLMMRGPGELSGGKIVDALVSHLDVFPTICDIIGVDKPARLQGSSLLPLVDGAVTELHEHVFSEVSFHAAYEPQRSVRSKRYKYIRRFADRTLPVLPNCDAGYSKDVWLEAGWRNAPVAHEQLYDLVFDPNETNNIADRAEYATALNAMRNTLQRWMQGTADPLLNGPLYAPPGVEVNDVDAIDPDANVIRYPNGQQMTA